MGFASIGTRLSYRLGNSGGAKIFEPIRKEITRVLVESKIDSLRNQVVFAASSEGCHKVFLFIRLRDLRLYGDGGLKDVPFSLSREKTVQRRETLYLAETR